MGDNLKYPEVRTTRYSKASTTNPNVTVYVVNLSVLKYIFPQQIKIPLEMMNNSYIGGMIWPSPTELSLTITHRDQTKAMTILCRAPTFICYEMHTEVTINDGWVLPSENPIYSRQHMPSQSNMWPNNTSNSGNIENRYNASFEYSTGSFLLKRLPVRDGEHGHFRHVVFISSQDKRAIPLTMGRFEVTEIVGWDETNEIVYFLAAPEQKPGQRHLYKITVKINATASANRAYITSSQPICLTCNNSPSTFKLINNINESHITTDEECTIDIPNNCLYNKIYFSKDYSFYVQECLGPESPSVYLVETQTNTKIFVLHAGDLLRRKLSQLALPQIRSFSVEIRHGFHAQVRLFLPPGMKEEEEVAFPLILHM